MSSMQDFYLKHLVDATPTVAEGAGASAYFSRPSEGLDPNLFDADQHLHPDLRAWILDTLYRFWAPTFEHAKRWSTVYIAGSGASYQWAADRGNGDLDILIGVDWEAFYAAEPGYDTQNPDAVAKEMDFALRSYLWPMTADTRIGNRDYEVTFYVNTLGADLDAIRVYAAYDVTHDCWAVRPPKLPQDPTTLWSEADWAAAAEDRAASAALREQFDTALAAAKSTRPGTPAWANALADLRRATYAATSLFNTIHLDRSLAFSSLGQGYFDPANFRWQAAKRNGVIDELSHIKRFHDQVDGRAVLYPTPTDVLVHRAIRRQGRT